MSCSRSQCLRILSGYEHPDLNHIGVCGKTSKTGLATFVFSARYVTRVVRNHAEICFSERRCCWGCL